MNKGKMMVRQAFLKLTALVIAILMILTVISLMPGEQSFAEGNSAPKAVAGFSLDMRLSQWTDLVPADYFTDSDGDQMTFFASEDEGANWTKVTGHSYRYYPPSHGTYKVLFKAQDAVGNQSDILTITISVEKPPSEVTVTFSVTQGMNKFFVSDNTQTVMVPTKLTVPYFDLSKYGLSRYYYNSRCYANHKDSDTPYSSAQEGGTAETAEGVVTAMHAFIYATEVLYLGYDEKDAGTGLSYEEGDFMDAISWTQGPGSSFMSLWGKGTNLNYYLNFAYPLGAPAWGSTSDQQPLYGGENISVHFIGGGAMGSDFAFLTADGSRNVSAAIDELTVDQGDTVTLTASVSRPDWNNYITGYAPYTDVKVKACKADELSGDMMEWEISENDNFGSLDEEGQVTIDTSGMDPGIYYVGVRGKEDSETKTESGPTAIKLTIVGGQVHEHQYGGFKYEWADDNSTVTASASCIAADCDGSAGKEITETSAVTSEVTRPATCEGKGETTYTARFRNPAFEEQSKKVEDIPALGHDWDEGTVTREATEAAEGILTYTCRRDASHTRTEAIPKLKPDPKYQDVDKITPSDATIDEKAKVSKNLKIGAGSITTTASVAKKTMTVKWQKSKGAVNYRVAYRTAGAKNWTNQWTKGKNSIVLKKLKKNGMYEFRILAVKKSGSVWTKSSWTKVNYRYFAGTPQKVRAGKKSFTVTVKKVKGATGYEVTYALKKTMTPQKVKTFKGAGKVKLSVKSLKSGKRYYVSTRPYKKYKGHKYIGVQSTVKTIRVK